MANHSPKILATKEKATTTTISVCYKEVLGNFSYFIISHTCV